jgi:hypothetical protein
MTERPFIDLAVKVSVLKFSPYRTERRLWSAFST